MKLLFETDCFVAKRDKAKVILSYFSISELEKEGIILHGEDWTIYKQRFDKDTVYILCNNTSPFTVNTV